MSSINNNSILKKIYIIPTTAKAYPGKVETGVSKLPNIGPIIQRDPTKPIHYINDADLARKIQTSDTSKVIIYRHTGNKDFQEISKKTLANENRQMHNYIYQSPSKELENKYGTAENANTEVVWVPSASQKSLVLENENIETLHDENKSDEDCISVSDENELLNSSSDTMHTYDSINTSHRKNEDSKSISARSNVQVVNQSSEKNQSSASRRTFNPKEILRQLKAINSTEVAKPGAYAHIEVSKREYFKEWLKHRALSVSEQDRKLYKYLVSKLKPSRVLDSHECLIIVSSLSHQLSHMWRKSREKEDIFYKNNSCWLDGPSIKLTSTPIALPPTSNIPDKLVRINIQTNADAFKFLKNLEPPFKAGGLIKLIPCTNLAPEEKAKLNDFCNRYVADMKFKWLISNDNEGVFFTKFESWLRLNIKWPAFMKDVLPKPITSESETIGNEESKLTSLSEEHMKKIYKCNITSIENILASKCLERGKDISKIIHRIIHHPEDAALIEGIMSVRNCTCYPKLAGNDIPEKDTIKKYKPPSQVQKDVLKKNLERLKDSMSTTKDPLKEEDTSESPEDRTKAHQTMLDQAISRLKVANLDAPNPVPNKEKVHYQMISKANVPIVIPDEDEQIETNQANKRSVKIVKGVFRFKVGSQSEITKQLNLRTVYLKKEIAKRLLNSNKEMIVDKPLDSDKTIDNVDINHEIHLQKEIAKRLLNSNTEMIVDKPLDSDKTIDVDSNHEIPTEQINENAHDNLEFGPVLDKLLFIQPINLPHGTIIRISKTKEATICKVSNCYATVLVPKFIKKSGPNVRVIKSGYITKRLVKVPTVVKNNTAT